MKPAPIDPPEIWHTLWDGVEGDVGWDVGANCGQTIPIMLERFAHVVAFEPAEECQPYLQAHVHGNEGDNLLILPLAVSDFDGDIPLIALPDKIDTGQLVTAGTHGMEWNPDDASGLLRRVPARTVDTLLKEGSLAAPDFMKIDVEGHELKVLFGARRTLAISRPELLIEFHSPELFDSVSTLLDGFGYDLRTIRHPHYPLGSDMYRTHGWIRARVSRR